MCAIQTSHYLEDGGEAPKTGNRNASSQSSYSYLFFDLANAPDAGCFTGTDDDGTIQRLKDFEEACRPGNPHFAPPALTFNVPAAYTYFGQFLNHDISAPVGGLLRPPGTQPAFGIVGTVDPDGLGKGWRATDVPTILLHFANEHPRPLTLASLYGDGPDSDDKEVQALYNSDGSFHLAKAFRVPPAILAESTKLGAATVYPVDALDIPRNGRLPLIADRRNDGNLILSQLHLAFLIFHNKAVEALQAKGTKAEDVFDKARQLVTLHYHWLILNDFLPALLSETVLKRPLSEWKARKIPARTVPMEFTTAAFRFGHSMVGRSYDFNANFGRGGALEKKALLQQLLNLTSDRKMDDERGRIPQLPDHWVIDWERLTRTQPLGDADEASGQAERIDLDFAPEMLNDAGRAGIPQHGSIFFRNLLRGFHRRIPFGQKLAQACGVPVLSPEKVEAALLKGQASGSNSPAKVAKKLGILEETPAWLYFLCEAQLLEDGTRVGPTASQIIADTIVSLMLEQSSPVLRNGGAVWHPRDSLLQDQSGKPLDSLRAFLLFSKNGQQST
jgi:hypothetical protein